MTVLLSTLLSGHLLTSSGSISATSYVPAQLRHVVEVHSPYTAVTLHDNFRRSTAAAVSRPYIHRRRSRLQAAPPYKLTSSWPPPLGRAYVTCTLYRRLGRLQAACTRHRRRFQAANVSTRRHPHNYTRRRHVLIFVPPHRRDPLSYYASSARSSPTCRRLRCTLPSAPRAPPQRAAHRQGTAAHVTARRRQLPRGRRFKAPRVCQNITPPRDRRSKKTATRGNRRA